MNSKHKNWIRKVEKDVDSAYCSYCMKEISIAGQDSKALDGHVRSQKHLKRVTTQLPLTFPTNVNSVDSSTSSKESKELKQQSIDMNVLKQDTLKLGIMWCTEVVMCNYSYHSCEKKNDLFASMFPDGKIASQFGLGETKCAYVILYGIALYVTDVLNDAVQEVPVYCLFTLFWWILQPCVKKVTNGPFDSFLGWECWHGQHTVLWHDVHILAKLQPLIIALRKTLPKPSFCKWCQMALMSINFFGRNQERRTM